MLVSEFVRAFNDEINRTSRDRDHQREGLQREQMDLQRRIDTLLDAFASGALKGPSVQTKLEALEARQGEVAKQLAGLVDKPVRLHPNLAAIYRRKVATLQSLLEDDASRTEAVEVIRSLVDQVIFRPTADAGLEVELVGDIARMVHLAQNSNENSPILGAVHDEFARFGKGGCGLATSFTERELNGGVVSTGRSYSQWFELGAPVDVLEGNRLEHVSIRLMHDTATGSAGLPLPVWPPFGERARGESQVSSLLRLHAERFRV